MKKLTTLILASLFCFGVFAAPKIPIGTLSDDFEPYIYMSNSGLNSYSIKAIIYPSGSVALRFINWSLITDENVSIQIDFNDEKTFYAFTKNFDLSDIENEFSKLRKSIISQNITASLNQVIDPLSSRSTIAKETTTDIKPNRPYHTWYYCRCTKNLELENAREIH